MTFIRTALRLGAPQRAVLIGLKSELEKVKDLGPATAIAAANDSGYEQAESSRRRLAADELQI